MKLCVIALTDSWHEQQNLLFTDLILCKGGIIRNYAAIDYYDVAVIVSL